PIPDGKYELRYDDESVGWDNAEYSLIWSTVTSPSDPQAKTVTGLTPNTTYYFWLKTRDKASNWSLVSNTTSTYAGPDTTPPRDITDLVATPGDYEGQIKLNWTVPGDNGTINNAQGYVVKYTTTPPFNWNTADEYTQSWIPGTPETTQEEMISSLIVGTEYWWAIKAYDEAPNYAMSFNTSSCQPAPPGARDAMMVFGEGTVAAPKYRYWSGASWGSIDNCQATEATINWTVLRSCNAMRDRKMTGILSSGNNLYLQEWNGTTSSWSTIAPSPLTSSPNSTYRPFDIAYEQNS
ncbi:unnamed protein product, partial [marine sediment metagenome]